jgi:hypothetical protein
VGGSVIGWRSALLVTLEAWCRDGGCRGHGEASQRQSAPEQHHRKGYHVMSKAMVIFVLLASGSLYDPQAVLSKLGPNASAFGYMLKHAIRGS